MIKKKSKPWSDDYVIKLISQGAVNQNLINGWTRAHGLDHGEIDRLAGIFCLFVLNKTHIVTLAILSLGCLSVPFYLNETTRILGFVIFWFFGFCSTFVGILHYQKQRKWRGFHYNRPLLDFASDLKALESIPGWGHLIFDQGAIWERLVANADDRKKIYAAFGLQ